MSFDVAYRAASPGQKLRLAARLAGEPNKGRARLQMRLPRETMTGEPRHESER